MKVKGKVVIVTASTRGIGWACVQACAERRAAAREAALERLFDSMEEQWEQEALDYWL